METKKQENASEAKLASKKRRLTVIVRAHNLFIWPQYPPPEYIVDDFTAIVDDRGFESRFGDENKKFTTDVDMGTDICWDIKVSDPKLDRGYSVALVSVFHNPQPAGPTNPNFFDHDPLLVGKNGKVCGTIVNRPILPGFEDSYSVRFTITGPNGNSPEFILDPRLTMKPSS